jgi:thioredoxin-like negative regulator of GroEL
VQGQVEGREDLIAYREVNIAKDAATAGKYGVQVTPTVIVLDPEGVIVDEFVGVPRESELETALREATSQ